MKIDSYSFGRIVIDGMAYTSDVILYKDRVDASWWRREGHMLQLEDITGILDSRPEILIIGTGYSGVMSVPKATREAIDSRGIELNVERTEKAVDLFNALQTGYKYVCAALHITC